MSKKISQYPELTTVTGEEETIIAFRGGSFRLKLLTLLGLIPLPTKEQLGLGNVDNTPDVSKPISTATAAALAKKANTPHTHAETEIEGLVNDLAVMNGVITNLSTSVATAMSTMAAIQELLGQDTTSIQTLLTQGVANAEAITALTGRVDNLTNGLAQLATQVTADQSNIQALTTDYASVVQQVTDDHNTISSLNNEMATISQDMATFTAAVAQDVATVNGMATNISAMTDTINDFSGSLAATNQAFVSLSNQFTALEQEVASDIAAKFDVPEVQADTPIDNIPTHIFTTINWLVQADGRGENAGSRVVMSISATHNGTDLTDATLVDYASYAKLVTGSIPGLTFSVILTGTGQDQLMQLCVASPEAPVDVHVVREDTVAQSVSV